MEILQKAWPLVTCLYWRVSSKFSVRHARRPALDFKNYKSGPEVEAILQELFELEKQEGRMFCLSQAEARARSPGNSLRVAAQGVFDKPGGGHRIQALGNSVTPWCLLLRRRSECCLELQVALQRAI